MATKQHVKTYTDWSLLRYPRDANDKHFIEKLTKAELAVRLAQFVAEVISCTGLS